MDTNRGKQWLTNPYLTIIVSGIFYFSAISTLYGWMSNVNEVKVLPRTFQYSIFPLDRHAEFFDGFHCFQHGERKGNTYCNEMAEQIVNNATNNAWKCDQYADYSNKYLFNDIRPFKFNLRWLIICTAMFAIFAIIHDCTLVYYKHNLNALKFYPHTRESIFYGSIISRRHCSKWIFYLCFPLVVISMIAQVCIMLTLYPFYVLIKDRSLYGFSYVSSLCVGVSVGNITSLSVLVLSTSWQFFKDLESLNPAKCDCQCTYQLLETDLWTFVVLTLGFVLTNVRFLYRWYRETVHGEQFLYLIKYTLPISKAIALNENGNPVGNMFGGSEKEHSLNSSSNYVQMTDVTVDNPQKPDVTIKSNDGCKMPKVSKQCRLIWFIWTISISCTWLSFVLLIFGILNTYNYPKAIPICIFAMGAAIPICILVGLVVSCKRLVCKV